MTLPLSRAVVPTLEVLDQIDSTNSELVRRASAGEAENFAVLVTTDQTAGRGRLGRTWTAPPGATVAVSVMLAPGVVPNAAFGWMPLLAGLAMSRAVTAVLPQSEVGVKWPNDVQVGGRKISGLLCEIAPNGGVVIGAGLNLTIDADNLPVPTATSLTLEGADPEKLLDRALSRYLSALGALLGAFTSVGFDAEVALRAQVLAVCTTIGRSVRVELPGGVELYGTAEDIDGDGRLVVRELSGSVLQRVAAGDVTHLRYE